MSSNRKSGLGVSAPEATQFVQGQAGCGESLNQLMARHAAGPIGPRRRADAAALGGDHVDREGVDHEAGTPAGAATSSRRCRSPRC